MLIRNATRTRISSGLIIIPEKVHLNQQIASTAREASSVRVQLTAKVHRASEVYSCIVLQTDYENERVASSEGRWKVKERLYTFPFLFK